MKVKVVVPKPLQRITRGMLKIDHASSSNKTLKLGTPSEVEVIEDYESYRRDYIYPE